MRAKEPGMRCCVMRCGVEAVFPAVTPYLFNVAAAADEQLERATEFLKPVEPLLYHVDARGVAQAHCAIIAKSCARYHRNIRLAQQTVGKILRSQAELTDIDEHIERPDRLDCGNVGDLGDAVVHVVR